MHDTGVKPQESVTEKVVIMKFACSVPPSLSYTQL